MRPFVRLGSAAGLVAALAATAPAFGQASQTGGADAALAESLFQESRSLFDAGRTAEACAKLAESQRLDPRPGTLLNLATCHERDGKTASAWAEFTQLASVAERAGQTDRAALARESAAKLSKRLSRLRVQAAGLPNDVSLELDGKPLGVAMIGSSVPLDPGEHVVTAGAPGKQRWSKALLLPPGPSEVTVEIPQLQELPLVAPAAPAAPPSRGDRAAPAEGASTAHVLGWIVAGAGVAGIAVGGVFGARTFSKSDASVAHCDGDDFCDPEGIALREEASDSGAISTVAFGVGLAALAAGIVIVFTTWPSADSGGSASAWLAPSFGPGAAGAALGGSF